MKTKRKSSLPNVVGILLCVLFIPIIIVNLILIVGTYTSPEEMPGVFGVKPVIVLSGSMEPEIRVGDLIFLHGADPQSLAVGDVICYLSSGKAITHRITEIAVGEDGQPRYITKGDANNARDRLAVAADQIQGIWRGGRVGGLGSVMMFMQTPAGLALFIMCPLLLFLLWDVWRRRREGRAEAARTAALEAELAELRSDRQPEGPAELKK